MMSVDMRTGLIESPLLSTAGGIWSERISMRDRPSVRTCDLDTGAAFSVDALHAQIDSPAQLACCRCTGVPTSVQSPNTRLGLMQYKHTRVPMSTGYSHQTMTRVVVL